MLYGELLCVCSIISHKAEADTVSLLLVKTLARRGAQGGQVPGSEAEVSHTISSSASLSHTDHCNHCRRRFTEMCRTHPTLVALSYLQTTLSSVVDHSDPSEASSFRSCMSAVLSAPPAHNCEVAMDEGTGGNGGDDLSSSQESEHEDGRKDEWLYRQRQDLFERLCGFVPEGERQPKEDLRDLATRREML